MGSATGAGHLCLQGFRQSVRDANSGYSFSGWYDGETLVSSANPYSFSMPYNDLSYEARFTEQLQVSLVFKRSGDHARRDLRGLRGRDVCLWLKRDHQRDSSGRLWLPRLVRWEHARLLNDSYSFSHPAKSLSFVAKYSKKYHLSVSSYDEAKGPFPDRAISPTPQALRDRFANRELRV
jgi:uncharacterized repeat protein (TIGR02543 family)